MQSIENAIARFFLILLCVALMVFGFGGAIYQIKHPPTVNGFVYTFIGIGVFGALGLPSLFDIIWPRAQKIFVLVFPNGLPMLGGRRASDPPPPGGPPTGPQI